MSQLLLSFYGDDFTGSTDAMESLARSGVRTVLFTQPPTPQMLARHPDLEAFGVAGTTRAMPPEEIEKTLRPAFTALREARTPIVHYKVCSTFDSAPQVGSIGRAIDVGAEVFDTTVIPVVVAAPALGRYCVFGNLFARCGSESEPHRLDRHPSASRHPVTPMTEADLRLHLSRQTNQPIGLLDVLEIDRPDVDERLNRIIERGCRVVLIDLLYESQLAAVGGLLQRRASRERPLFIVGSSGVESALAAHWRREPVHFPPVRSHGPILAICGSCSPVTAAQIDRAAADRFEAIPFEAPDARERAITSLRRGASAILHTRQARAGTRIGQTLGRLAREVLSATGIHRLLVAGGDTSGQVARELGIVSMQMVGELVRGSPLCQVEAPGSPADGIEITFKGGQIGPADFFTLVEKGDADG